MLPNVIKKASNIELTDELLDKVQAHVCRKSLYRFVETFWGVIIPEEIGRAHV